MILIPVILIKCFELFSLSLTRCDTKFNGIIPKAIARKKFTAKLFLRESVSFILSVIGKG